MNYGIKKITALLMVFAVILCLGAMPVFAEEVTDSAALHKAKTLEALGLLPGAVTAEEFCAREGITRAEMTSVMVKMSGIDNTATADTTVYFKDVEDGSQYAADIASALQLGIINGNGDYTFRPDEFVSYEALAKMAVATLGYDTQAQLMGGFPTGYMQMASKIGLKSIAAAVKEEAVSGGFAADFLYEMLDTDVSYVSGVGSDVVYTTTEGKTLLTENLKIYTAEGILTGNKNSDLYGTPTLDEGEVAINEVTYNYSGESSEMLGMNVKAYYKEERGAGIKDVIYIEPSNDNKILIIDAEDASYLGGVFSYFDESDRKKTVSVDSGAAIVYNGRAITNAGFDMTKLVPEEGQIKLIDNGLGSGYNVIVVSAYTNVVVDTVDVYQGIIYDKYLATRNIVLGKDNYELYDAESGKAITVSDISAFDVLTVMKSDDNSYVIKRNNKSVGGTIQRTASDSEKVYINDVLYHVSHSYITSGQAKLAVGEAATFLLDINGKITGKKTSRDSRIKIGLVVKLVVKENGLTSTPVIKMVTMLGEEQVYDFADTVEVDGVKIKIEETDADGNNKVAAAISKGATGYSEKLAAELPDAQLIRYTLDSENKINMVDTIEHTDGVESENTLSRSLSYDAGVGSGDGLYFKSKNANGKEIVGDESIVFVVTLPLSGKIEDSVSVAAGSYFTNSKFIIESYKYTEDKISADAVICYRNEESAILGSYANELFVDEVGVAIGKDEVLQTQISGWYIGSYSTFLLKENANIDFEIKKGDLIGFETNADGEIYLADHIYSVEKDKYTMTPEFRKNDSNPMDNFYYVNAAAGTFDNGRVFAYGHLYHKFENDIVMTKTETISEAAMTDSANQVKVNIGGAYIYVYDKDDARNPVRLGTKADLLAYRTDSKNPSRIIVRATNALAKTVFIIK